MQYIGDTYFFEWFSQTYDASKALDRNVLLKGEN